MKCPCCLAGRVVLFDFEVVKFFDQSHERVHRAIVDQCAQFEQMADPPIYPVGVEPPTPYRSEFEAGSSRPPTPAELSEASHLTDADRAGKKIKT
eukprot:gene189-22306_t